LGGRLFGGGAGDPLELLPGVELADELSAPLLGFEPLAVSFLVISLSQAWTSVSASWALARAAAWAAAAALAEAASRMSGVRRRLSASGVEPAAARAAWRARARRTWREGSAVVFANELVVVMGD